MVRFFFIVLVVLVLFGSCSDQYFSDRTTQNNRISFKKKITKELPTKALNQNSDSIDWNEVFWAFPAFNQSNDTIIKIYKKAVTVYPTFDENKRYSFWLAANTLHKPLEKKELLNLLNEENNYKIKVAAANYFLNNFDTVILSLENIENFYRLLFSQQISDTAYESLSFSEFKKMLTSDLYSGRKHIISFQSKNRNFAGRAIIIDGSGTLVKGSNGKLQTFSQLARSASNYPYYLTNGNTPCGIYSIQGIEESTNVFIGPVPTIQTRLPFEADPEQFFHHQLRASEWSMSLYKKLLTTNAPEQFFQTFWAGKIGRSEIILHGTTINPEFFKHQPFYPHTPSLGCITALERWNENTGKLLQSEQMQLIQAYQSARGENGYLIVINITDENKEINEDDILNYVGT